MGKNGIELRTTRDSQVEKINKLKEFRIKKRDIQIKIEEVKNMSKNNQEAMERVDYELKTWGSYISKRAIGAYCWAGYMFLEGFEIDRVKEDEKEKVYCLASSVESLQISLLIQRLLILKKNLSNNEFFEEQLMLRKGNEKELRAILAGLADYMVIDAKDKVREFEVGREFGLILDWYYGNLKRIYCETEVFFSCDNAARLSNQLKSIWKVGNYQTAYYLGKKCASVSGVDDVDKLLMLEVEFQLELKYTTQCFGDLEDNFAVMLNAIRNEEIIRSMNANLKEMINFCKKVVDQGFDERANYTC